MNEDLKSCLYLAGGIIAGILGGVGAIKTAKYLYSKSKTAKKRKLENEKKELESELEDLCVTQKIIQKNIDKIEEICHACYDNSTGGFRQDIPGYEDMDFAWLTERSNQLPILMQNNKMAVLAKDIQIKAVELKLMKFDKNNKNSQSKT